MIILDYPGEAQVIAREAGRSESVVRDLKMEAEAGWCREAAINQGMRTTSRSWKRLGKRFFSTLSDRNAALPSFDFSSVTDFGFQSFRTERSYKWVVWSHGVDSNLLQQLQEIHPLFKKKTEFIERAFSSLQLQLPCAVLSCVWLFGTLPTRLFCPWDVPGKNTGAGYHFFFQGIFLSQGSNSSLLHWQVDSLPLSHVGSPGRTDAEAESPILWPPDMKSQLTGKDAAAGKDWGQE